jgi:hypothetical protein
MPIEAVLMAVILLLVLAVLICIGVIYRMGRGGTTVSPILDQRLLSIEGSISRSDSTIREEFGRGPDETREASRSLREEVTGQFRALSESVRGSIGDLTTGQNTRLADFAEGLDGAKNAAAADAKALREEIQGTLQRFRENVGNRIGELIAIHGENLDGVTGQISALRETQEVVDVEAGRRRRAMDRKLRDLESLPEIEAATVLELEHIDDVESDEEAREAAE